MHRIVQHQLSPSCVSPPKKLLLLSVPIAQHIAVIAVVVLGCLVLTGCGLGNNSLIGKATDEVEPTASAEVSGAVATIVKVLDGDTVDVKLSGNTERVRLIGIDTPEATGGILPAECFGDEASVFTKLLLPVGTQVLLTRDQQPRDRYGRLLAYIHRATDGLFVNLEIVSQGYAEALIIEPNNIYADHFYTAAHTARQEGLGLWSSCGNADVRI